MPCLMGSTNLHRPCKSNPLSSWLGPDPRSGSSQFLFLAEEIRGLLATRLVGQPGHFLLLDLPWGDHSSFHVLRLSTDLISWVYVSYYPLDL